jgi:ketosteroid isomerase-like protein
MLPVMIAKLIFSAKPVLWLCLTLAAGAARGVAGESTGAPADVDDIRHLIGEYAQAVDTADVELVKRIWSSSPEVSFIHPLGHEHGLDQIAQNVFHHLMGDTFSEREIRVKDVSIHAYGDAAWAEFYWDFTAKLRKDGSPLATHGRETQIYHKEQGRWRLVHVHYSGMPVTGAGQGF